MILLARRSPSYLCTKRCYYKLVPSSGNYQAMSLDDTVIVCKARRGSPQTIMLKLSKRYRQDRRDLTNNSKQARASSLSLEEIKACLVLLLKQLNPDEVLTFVIQDKEIYEVCKNDPTLRRNCIIGALRRYNIEKFFYPDVKNRTADYMVMLDAFMKIQEEYERKNHIF